MRISWLPRNIRVVDLASAFVIMSLGFLINVMYFTVEYFERTGSVLAQVWGEPVEHALVIAMAPLYLAIGRLYWQEKKSKKELEASNKLKDLFTDVLRHDLLNPVGVIQTSSELLEESSEDKELVSMIKRQALRLEDLISNASKLAKMEYQEELKLEDL
ncbi:MAG: histidine kinase dimerization/phospho-acceptor domain-containing protein, partial [Candidatus Hydrothermarchaeales archaeon]